VVAVAYCAYASAAADTTAAAAYATVGYVDPVANVRAGVGRL